MKSETRYIEIKVKVDALNSCYHDDIIVPKSFYSDVNEAGEEVLVESQYRFDFEFYAN